MECTRRSDELSDRALKIKREMAQLIAAADSTPGPCDDGHLAGQRVSLRVHGSVCLGVAGAHDRTPVADVAPEGLCKLGPGRGSNFHSDFHKCAPPVACRSAPVMKLPASEHNSSAAPAISSGVPARPMGLACA